MLLLLLYCPRPRPRHHLQLVCVCVLVLQLVWCVVCGVCVCVCTGNQTFIFCADDDAPIIILFVRVYCECFHSDRYHPAYCTSVASLSLVARKRLVDDVDVDLC